jgi:flagellar M-ring protein FliF
MISSLPLGSSRAVEGQRLRSADELDLARTIEAIDAVQKARVHLAVEQPSAFLRDRPSRRIGDADAERRPHAVRQPGAGDRSPRRFVGFRHVPGRCLVADQNGRLLSSRSDGGLTDATERQVAVQAKIEERYRQSIETLLTPILGADNFTAQVHADVDFLGDAGDPRRLPQGSEHPPRGGRHVSWIARRVPPAAFRALCRTSPRPLPKWPLLPEAR